jgi:hypothetical protein
MKGGISAGEAVRWLSRILLPSVICLACSPLEPMTESICGNSVVEAGEECDTHAEWPGAICKPPGDTSNQCVYRCSADGVDGTCPPDFFCGVDGRCVAPDGTFTPTGAFLGGNAGLLEVPVVYYSSVVMLGNDIGDGRRPVTAWDYVDFERALASELPIGFEMASPTLWSIGEEVEVEPVSAFVNRALAFVGEHGIQAVKRPENYAPKLVAIPMPAEPSPSSLSREVRVVSVLGSASARLLDGGKSLLELEDSGDGLVFRRVDRPEPPLLDLSWTSKRLADVRGGAVLGDWDARPESPCREVVVPLDGLEYLPLISFCAGSRWSDAPDLGRIRLPQVEGTRNVVTGAARALDVDLDGALDVVFGASLGPYVAYGLGDGTFSPSPHGIGEKGLAAPLTLELSDESTVDDLPLDGADLNADGYVDYALPGGIALSQKSDGKLFWAHRSPGWAEAKIDRQGGRVLATSPESGIDVLTYLASAEQFVRSRWGTVLPASHLALGDFDGDATTDVAFTQSTEGAASVWVALGGPRRSEVPEKVADFAAVSDLQAVYLDTAWAPPDAVGDLVISGKLAGSEGETFSFLHGNANGEFSSPLVLRREDGEREVPFSIAASALATSPRFLAAVSAAPGPSPQPLRLWAFNPDGELGGGTMSFSAPLPDGFSARGGTVPLRYGAHLAAGAVSGSDVSDIVLVAPFEAPEERSALVVGRLEGARIATDEPLVLDGVADPLTRLRVADVDGDGWNDVVLRPSGAAEPPLWILWNDGSGRFSRDALTELRPTGGVNDFTCDAVSRPACALLVVTPEGAFTVEARGRELELRSLPEATGGLAIGSFNSLDTSSLLVGGVDATSVYHGGLKRPGMIDAPAPAP